MEIQIMLQMVMVMVTEKWIQEKAIEWYLKELKNNVFGYFNCILYSNRNNVTALLCVEKSGCY